MRYQIYNHYGVLIIYEKGDYFLIPWSNTCTNKRSRIGTINLPEPSKNSIVNVPT